MQANPSLPNPPESGNIDKPTTPKVFPDNEKFVWVQRKLSVEIQLAFYSGGKFQDPYTTGDSEGLNVEYFYDVTRWEYLRPPNIPSSESPSEYNEELDFCTCSQIFWTQGPHHQENCPMFEVNE